MWAAKLPGEGYALYETCSAMCDIMSELGIAVDGGKDSLSMAAKVDSEVVKAPGKFCKRWVIIRNFTIYFELRKLVNIYIIII